MLTTEKAVALKADLRVVPEAAFLFPLSRLLELQSAV